MNGNKLHGHFHKGYKRIRKGMQMWPYGMHSQVG